MTDKIFFFFSGTSIELIKLCPESENIKYKAIGALIACTALFAMFAGGYAHLMIFFNWYFAILFGFFWGLIILSIDRYLVLTMRKSGIWQKDIIYASPRIILAIIIAVSISRPIELRLFAAEIDDALQIRNIVKIDNHIQKLNTEIESYRKQLSTIAKQESEAYNQYLCEYNGTCGTFRHDYGPHAKEKWKEYMELRKKNEPEVTAITATINNLQTQIVTSREKRITLLTTAASSRTLYTGNALMLSPSTFLSRSDALWELSQQKKGICIISLLVTLIFFMIEILPIFTKLISEPGKYDYLRGLESEKAKIEFEGKLFQLRGELHVEQLRDYDRQMETAEKSGMVRLKNFTLSEGENAERISVQRLFEQWQSKNVDRTEQLELIDKNFHEKMLSCINGECPNKPPTDIDEANGHAQATENSESPSIPEIKRPPEAREQRSVRCRTLVWLISGILMSTCIVTLSPLLLAPYVRLGRDAVYTLSFSAGGIYVALVATIFTVIQTMGSVKTFAWSKEHE